MKNEHGMEVGDYFVDKMGMIPGSYRVTQVLGPEFVRCQHVAGGTGRHGDEWHSSNCQKISEEEALNWVDPESSTGLYLFEILDTLDGPEEGEYD